MRTSNFNAKECTVHLNNVRILFENKTFTKDYLLGYLKNAKTICNKTFWYSLIRLGIIAKSNDGKFAFTSKEPVYYEKVQDAYNDYCNRINKYKQSKQVETISVEEIKSTEHIKDTETFYFDNIFAFTQFAIDYLKDKGYKILAPSKIIYNEI